MGSENHSRDRDAGRPEQISNRTIKKAIIAEIATRADRNPGALPYTARRIIAEIATRADRNTEADCSKAALIIAEIATRADRNEAAKGWQELGS